MWYNEAIINFSIKITVWQMSMFMYFQKVKTKVNIKVMNLYIIPVFLSLHTHLLTHLPIVAFLPVPMQLVHSLHFLKFYGKEIINHALHSFNNLVSFMQHNCFDIYPCHCIYQWNMIFQNALDPVLILARGPPFLKQ